MLEYFTIAACFIDFADDATKKARRAIDEALTKDVVKAGWTYPNALKATELLGDSAINRVRGRFLSIKTHTNKDERNGNEYPKIRVELNQVSLIKCYQDASKKWCERPSTTKASDDGSVIVSLDANQEAAHRLVAKLSAVKPGQVITIIPFAEAVERNGRTFVNHIVSIKDEAGAEIVSSVDYFNQFRDKTRALETELEKLGMDRNSIKDQVKRQKARLFMELADTLGKDLPAIVPTKKAEKDEKGEAAHAADHSAGRTSAATATPKAAAPDNTGNTGDSGDLW